MDKKITKEVERLTLPYLKKLKWLEGILEEKIRKTTTPTPTPITVDYNHKRTPWQIIYPKIADSVVRLVSIKKEFNWFDPHSPLIGRGSSGSAFFIDKKGTLVSNYHVIAESEFHHILIPSQGDKKFKVDILGISPERDIALLRMTKEALVEFGKETNALKFGDSDEVTPGQMIAAYGFPLGLEQIQLTDGKISGRQRLGYFGYIQMTAPINPGNSGGPSINVRGEVIGINSRGAPSAQNVGWIIPINEVKTVIDDLSEKEKIIRKPHLGAIFLTPTDELFKRYNNKFKEGYFITKLFENSILKNNGIKENDFILKINGHNIDKYGKLLLESWPYNKVSIYELLNRYHIDDKIIFTIIRSVNGRSMKVQVPIEFKENPRAIREIYPKFEKNECKWFNFGGMILMNLKLNHLHSFQKFSLGIPYNLYRYMKYENQGTGVVIVTKVFPGTEASKSEIFTPGTIIRKVNGVKVRSLKDFKKNLTKFIDEKDYVEIITKNNLKALFSYRKIVKGEKEIPKRYPNYIRMIPDDIIIEKQNKRF